jgi:hypothetical protein
VPAEIAGDDVCHKLRMVSLDGRAFLEKISGVLVKNT